MSLLGTVGSIGGSVIGGYFGGPSGAAAGGQIGGALGNGLSSMASTAYSYHMDMKQAQALMDLQYEQQKKLALNKYPWEVQSLEAAGLNPILAATRGASAYSANAPVIQAKRGQEAVNSALALGQLDNLGAQNQLIKAQAATQSATANQIKEQTKVVERENKLFERYPELYEIYKSQQSYPVLGPLAFGLHRIFSEGKELIPRKQRYPINMDGY